MLPSNIYFVFHAVSQSEDLSPERTRLQHLVEDLRIEAEVRIVALELQGCADFGDLGEKLSSQLQSTARMWFI